MQETGGQRKSERKQQREGEREEKRLEHEKALKQHGRRCSICKSQTLGGEQLVTVQNNISEKLEELTSPG